MKTYYTIWCEWDIGQENQISENLEEANVYARELWNFQNMDEEVDMTFDEAIQEGLISFGTIELDI